MSKPIKRRDQDWTKMYVARRTTVKRWLTAEGMSEGTADAWCDRWDAEAARRGLPRAAIDYWQDAGPWIADRPRGGPSTEQ